MANDRPNPSEMTSFGIFYPRGYLVVAVPGEQDAKQVRQDLLTGGYEADDCVLVSAEEVAHGAERNLEGHTGLLARLGKSDEAVGAHLKAAREGSTFLLIYAPGDIEAERAMNVVRRVPFQFAHRYHRLAIQSMQ